MLFILTSERLEQLRAAAVVGVLPSTTHSILNVLVLAVLFFTQINCSKCTRSKRYMRQPGGSKGRLLSRFGYNPSKICEEANALNAATLLITIL